MHASLINVISFVHAVVLSSSKGVCEGILNASFRISEYLFNIGDKMVLKLVRMSVHNVGVGVESRSWVGVVSCSVISF